MSDGLPLSICDLPGFYHGFLDDFQSLGCNLHRVRKILLYDYLCLDLCTTMGCKHYWEILSGFREISIFHEFVDNDKKASQVSQLRCKIRF